MSPFVDSARAPRHHNVDMSDSSKPTLVALHDERERVIARLSDGFARELLDIDEFERRLTVAHRAETVAELAPLVEDLGPAPTTALVPATPTAPLATIRDRQTLAAILGGTMRRGPWTPPRRLKIIACMGGVDLDFREALLGPGVTEVVIFTIMGGVNLIVPPTLAVEVEGTAIMGGFDHTSRASAEIDPDRPRLRVSGVAVMGGVSFSTRLPGESEREARRRRRHERRALRHAERPALPERRD
jgi:uncharacterized protein DUF1707/cell wall-active antibiotic response 4TMS protein YvqF